MSPNAVRTLYRLHKNGFIAYLVGGCVRDLLLSRTPKDFDIATSATPGQIKRLFRNCRLIGRRFRLAHLHFQDEILEVSTFRRSADSSEVQIPGPGPEEAANTRRRPWHLKDEEGMVLVDNVFGSPEEDALRRDFTINALAYNIADFSVIDYSTGLSDLKERLIRPIGDPQVRFTEDPVRMLRAIRFAASHDFVISSEAWDSICELSSTITRVSSARLYEEVQKLFLLGSARPALSLLDESGALAALFPSLDQWIDERTQNLKTVQGNLETFDTLDRNGSPSSPALFLAALFGPGLEEAALARHREGIPHHQALDEACAVLLAEITRTVCFPRKVTDRMRAILALQPALRKMPPKRPAAHAAKPEFHDALAYLRLKAEVRKEYRASIEWWETFLSRAPVIVSGEKPGEEAAAADAPRKRRRRRRRHRPPGQTTTDSR